MNLSIIQYSYKGQSH